ncbi:MAG: hypothetical protein WC869_00610 [Phycisphaerae bacterium]|jgi:hypothetical protein
MKPADTEPTFHELPTKVSTELWSRFIKTLKKPASIPLETWRNWKYGRRAPWIQDLPAVVKLLGVDDKTVMLALRFLNHPDLHTLEDYIAVILEARKAQDKKKAAWRMKQRRTEGVAASVTPEKAEEYRWRRDYKKDYIQLRAQSGQPPLPRDEKGRTIFPPGFVIPPMPTNPRIFDPELMVSP